MTEALAQNVLAPTELPSEPALVALVGFAGQFATDWQRTGDRSRGEGG